MWQRCGENWDVKKHYLMRSMFEDHSRSNLPIVQEADDSFDSIRETVSPPSPEASPSCSPLPSLIIEKEPNKHDEPEEYYKDLEIMFRRAYRKIFIEGKSDLDEEEEDEEVDAAADIDADSTIDNHVDEQDLSNKSTSIDEINGWERDNSSHYNEVFVENNEESNFKANDNGFNKPNENIEFNLQNSDENIKIHRKRSISNQDNDNSESKKSKSNTLTEVIENESAITECSEDEVILVPNDFRDHRVVQVEAMIHTNVRDEIFLPAVAADFDDNDDVIHTNVRDEMFLPAVADDNDDVIHTNVRDEMFLPAVADDFDDNDYVIHTNVRDEMFLPAVDFDDNDDVSPILEENRVPDNLNSSGRKRSWSSTEESVSVVDVGTQTRDYNRVNQNILRDIFVWPTKVYRLCT